MSVLNLTLESTYLKILSLISCIYTWQNVKFYGICTQINTTTEIQLRSTTNKTIKMHLNLNKERMKTRNLTCQERQSLALPWNI